MFNDSNDKQETQTPHTHTSSLFITWQKLSNFGFAEYSGSIIHNTNGAILNNMALWPLRMRIHFTFASENSDVECALCEIVLAFCYVKIYHSHTHVECKNLFIQVL